LGGAHGRVAGPVGHHRGVGKPLRSSAPETYAGYSSVRLSPTSQLELRDRTNADLSRMGSYAIVQMRISQGCGAARSYKCGSLKDAELRDRTNADLSRMRSCAIAQMRGSFIVQRDLPPLRPAGTPSRDGGRAGIRTREAGSPHLPA